ncbi:MAG: hypothetical protein WCF85_05910 [Rhodospirillaceae bacterium]
MIKVVPEPDFITVRRLKGQEGAVLPFIMVMMAVLMMIGTGVFQYIVLVEIKEVDASLADVRAYWAMMGHFNYMAIRAGKDGLCSGSSGFCGGNDFSGNGAKFGSRTLTWLGGSTDTIGASLQHYLDGNSELQMPADLNNPGVHHWYYPLRTDSFSPYWFDVWASVRQRDKESLAPLSAGATYDNNDQLFIMDLELNHGTVSFSSLSPLANIQNRLQRLMIGFCSVDSFNVGIAEYKKGCGNPVSDVSSAGTATGRGSVDGQIKIQFIQRAPLCTGSGSGTDCSKVTF